MLSYANAPVICFSPMVRSSAGQRKVNVVSEDFGDRMNRRAPEFPPEVDKFDHVAGEIVTDFKVDPDLLGAIGRMGGPTYVRTTDRFDMIRPKS